MVSTTTGLLENIHNRFMAKSPALLSKLKSFSEKLAGTSHIDNANNPNSANAKMTASIKTPTQQRQKFVSLLPSNQKTFGVPGTN